MASLKSIMIENHQALARVLATLRGEVDRGHLAVGHIADKFNVGLHECERLSSRAVGNLLRKSGLTITTGKVDANGRRRVHNLIWDDNADRLSVAWPTD